MTGAVERAARAFASGVRRALVAGARGGARAGPAELAPSLGTFRHGVIIRGHRAVPAWRVCGGIGPARLTASHRVAHRGFAAGDAARGDDQVASSSPPPFVFVSAAEARWDFRAPVGWLEEYLVAKRAVESRLATLNEKRKLRASWLRPSLVYTFEKPAALPAVFAFALGNAVGIPFVDRPVTVDTLARAAVRALSDGKTSGCLDYREMERLANLR